MTAKRGGPRHFSKPYIEAGLLFQVFSQHEDRVQDFKTYEHLSSGSSPDPKGIIYCLGLLQDLIKIAPQAELHPSPLRDAMLRLLTNKPLLNTSGHNGAVWCNGRAERVNVLLAHLRKLKRSGPSSRCASMLTGLEYTQLADLLKLVQPRPEEGKDPLPLENGEAKESPSKKVKKQDSQEHQPKKKLKKEDSDISLDSQGFPSFLKTPEHEKQKGTRPSRLLQKRVGQSVHGENPDHGQLKKAMGVGHLKKCMKRPAAAGSLKKPAAAGIPAAEDTECTGGMAKQWPSWKWKEWRVEKAASSPGMNKAARSFGKGTTSKARQARRAHLQAAATQPQGDDWQDDGWGDDGWEDQNDWQQADWSQDGWYQDGWDNGPWRREGDWWESSWERDTEEMSTSPPPGIHLQLRSVSPSDRGRNKKRRPRRGESSPSPLAWNRDRELGLPPISEPDYSGTSTPEKGKRQRQRSSSQSSSGTMVSVASTNKAGKIWRKKSEVEAERQAWLDQKEKKPHHREASEKREIDKEASEKREIDKEASEKRGVHKEASEKREIHKEAPEKGGVHKEASEKREVGDEQASSSAKGSSSTAASERRDGVKDEVTAQKKHLMVDYHNTLSTGNHIITEDNKRAMERLLQNYDVTVCSWCFQERAKEVLDNLSKQSFFPRPKSMKAAKKGSSSKAKPATNAPLRKGNLEKLGEMSLKEKVKQIAEEHEDEVGAAMVLKETMSNEEKTKAWNRHNKHLQKVGNEEEKEEFQNASKKEKGLLTALWLMRQDAPKFCTVVRKTSLDKELTKTERWLSEKEALEKWGKDDLDKHIQSGRVIWRETSSWDVYEYCDTQDWQKKTTAKHNQQWLEAQEYQQNEDEQEEWEEHLNRDLLSLMNEFAPGKGGGKGAASGKGATPGKGKTAKALAPGKGNKGPGNRERNQRENIPLEDMPLEEQLPAALQKLRKTRDIPAHTHSNYEEALEKVKKLSYLGKGPLKEKEALLKALQSTLESVKKHLVKGEKNKLGLIKDLLKESVKVIKDAKEEAKELVQISMKTTSKASAKDK
eukprot:s4807_g1.t1